MKFRRFVDGGVRDVLFAFRSFRHAPLAALTIGTTVALGLGLVVGGGLAVGLATVLMATPAAATIGEVVHVFDPMSYAGSLTCITAACVLAALIPALRAARMDPMKTLRQE